MTDDADRAENRKQGDDAGVERAGLQLDEDALEAAGVRWYCGGNFTAWESLSEETRAAVCGELRPAITAYLSALGPPADDALRDLDITTRQLQEAQEEADALREALVGCRDWMGDGKNQPAQHHPGCEYLLSLVGGTCDCRHDALVAKADAALTSGATEDAKEAGDGE